jgi:hypothetical protein
MADEVEPVLRRFAGGDKAMIGAVLDWTRHA